MRKLCTGGRAPGLLAALRTKSGYARGTGLRKVIFALIAALLPEWSVQRLDGYSEPYLSSGDLSFVAMRSTLDALFNYNLVD